MSIESESWSYSKGTQLRGIGWSDQKVVELQEIKPKVRFLVLQGFYIHIGGSFKAPLEPCIVQ